MVPSRVRSASNRGGRGFLLGCCRHPHRRLGLLTNGGQPVRLPGSPTAAGMSRSRPTPQGPSRRDRSEAEGLDADVEPPATHSHVHSLGLVHKAPSLTRCSPASTSMPEGPVMRSTSAVHPSATPQSASNRPKSAGETLVRGRKEADPIDLIPLRDASDGPAYQGEVTSALLIKGRFVGLGGLEPPPSSLSGIEGSALCGPAFSQVTAERQGSRDAFLATSSQAVQANRLRYPSSRAPRMANPVRRPGVTLTVPPARPDRLRRASPWKLATRTL